MSSVVAIKSLVKEVATLSANLPPSVQQATKEDKIWCVINSDRRDTAHETFNRRFDALFGEDCHDSAGRLHHIRKGKLSMGLVCVYLSKCDWSDGFPLDLVEIKLRRIITELKYLQYVLFPSFPLSHY